MFEKKGQPTDRMKSQEELAREERERLEKLEVTQLKSFVNNIRAYKWLGFLKIKASFDAAICALASFQQVMENW